MKSYNLMWDDKIRKIVLSYAECRKLYIDDIDIIDLLMKEELSENKYHLYKFNDHVYYIIKDIRIEKDKIKNMVIFLLSNDQEEIMKAYFKLKDDIHLGINNLLYMYHYKKDNSIGYFFDDSIGIIKNYERCLNNNKFMLSDIHKLNEITKLELRNNNYYLGNTKYACKEDYDKYVSKYFNKIDRGLIDKELYVVLRHIGEYKNMYKTYNKLLKLISEEKKEIIGLPMEQFICGKWNTKDESKYVTNIMIPIKK